MWQTFKEGGFHELLEKVKRVLPLKLAGSGDCQDPFGETLTVLGLVSEAELSPLYFPQASG